MATIKDEWDALASADPALPLSGGTAAPPAASPALELLVTEYESLSVLVERESERLKNIMERIAEEVRLASDAVGEGVVVPLSHGSLRVERGERWSWDEDVLIGIIGDTDEVPEPVRRKLTVDKRGYEKADGATQSKLLPALTRKPGALKITIERSL